MAYGRRVSVICIVVCVPFGCQSVCPSTYSSSFHSSVHPQVHLYTPRPPTHIHSSVYLIHTPICFCTNLILHPPTALTHRFIIHPSPTTHRIILPSVCPSTIYSPTPICSPPPHTPPTYSIYLPTHSVAHPFKHSSYQFTYSFKHPPYPSIHPPTPIHTCTHSFIPHQFIYPTTPIQLLFHPSAPSIHLFAHPYQFVHTTYPFHSLTRLRPSCHSHRNQSTNPPTLVIIHTLINPLTHPGSGSHPHPHSSNNPPRLMQSSTPSSIH